MQVPNWLDDTAKAFWRKHYKALGLAPEHEEGFGVLCQTYSDYRQAQDFRQKKTYLDLFLKMSREWRLTPKNATKKDSSAAKKDELADFLGGQ